MASFCTVAQLLQYALPQEAVQNLSNAQLQAECDAASTLATGYLNGRYPNGVATWDIDLSMNVAYIAAYNILAARGYNPEQGADSIYRDRWVAAIEWLKGVQRQAIHPNITPNPTGTPLGTFPVVMTERERPFMLLFVCEADRLVGAVHMHDFLRAGIA